MKFGSLFAGIGGFDLGLERAGMKCAWQVEIDPYARKVLAKHWPAIPRWDDVRTFPPRGDWSCDLIAGGFPCQDISYAGKGAGIEGARSGLWSEYIRIVRQIRPRFIIVENVPALLERGMGRILGDLACSGFDAEWISLSAAEFGADHERNRIFILAYAMREQCGNERYSTIIRSREIGADNNFWKKKRNKGKCIASGLRADSIRRSIEAGIFGMADGIPEELERIRCLGNAVVPQVAQWIGERIMEYEKQITPSEAR